MSEKKITPLHQAVIDGDEAAVANLVNMTEWRQATDPLGFTPLELAQLLGRLGCQHLLGGILPRGIKVQQKGEKKASILPLKTYEKIFGVFYQPFLTFSSYKSLSTLIHNCPFPLRYDWLAKENYAWTDTYKTQLLNGAILPTYIKWIDDVLGYGFFADADIPAGTYIGEYTGLVRQLSRRHPDQNAYCFHYPTRFWSLNYYVIDGKPEGNVMRFMNHSDEPNTHPLCLVDRRLLHLVFIASKPISKDTQLTFNYGEDYWAKRTKVKNI